MKRPGKIALSRISIILLLMLTAYSCTTINVWNVVPDIATTEGGVEVTIYGDGMNKAGIRVFFGDLEANNVVVVADDIITASVPGVLREGAIEVRVEDQGGNVGILPAGFTYYDPGHSLTYTLPGYHLPAGNGTGWGGDAVDVDDDGDIDILVANGPTPDRFYENLLAETGALNFTEHKLPGGIRDSMDILFVDGFAFVVKNRIKMETKGKNNLFKVSKDDSDGPFIFEDYSLGNLPEEIDRGMKAALGDLDNDGDLDIFVANGFLWQTHPFTNARYREQNRIYLNQGDTDGDGAPNFEFTTTASFPEIQEISTDVALGDLDNDGDLDVIVGNFNDGPPSSTAQCADCPNRVYLNSNAGDGDSAPVFDEVTDTWFSEMPDTLMTTNVELGDVDKDGDLDLLVITTGDANLLFLNEIDTIGRFVLTDCVLPADPEINTHLYNSNYDAKFEDFNGDEYLDILLGGELLRAFINNGNPEDLQFTEISSEGLPFHIFSSHVVRTADFDNDGGIDFVCLNSNEQDRLFLNDLNANGTGRFIDYTSDNLPPDGEHGRDIEFGDLDGDHDLDIVVANSIWTNSLYLNLREESGGGYVAASERLPEVFETHLDVSRDVEIFDSNGDGNLDLFFLNQNTQNRLYINDGNANFTDETDGRLPADTQTNFRADTGDIDGDGDPDIITAVWGQSKVYLNDGNGFFQDVTATHIPQTPNPDGLITHDIQLADLDGDEDLDAVLANYASRNRIYLNDGTGHFIDATAERFPAEEMLLSRAIAIGDLDQDGDPDIFFANGGEELYKQNWLYFNDGNGWFTSMDYNIPQFEDGSINAKLEDVNRDGLFDILVVNNETPNRLLFNDPANPGTFYEMTRIAIEDTVAGTEDYGYGAAFGDTDGDGIPELLTANDGQNRLFFLDIFVP